MDRSSIRYQVTCEDGRIRHADLFESRSDASKWAEWGHCCTADHVVEPVEDHGPGCDGPGNCVCSVQRYAYDVVGLQGWEAVLHLTNDQADGLACIRCGRPAVECGDMDVNARVYTAGGAFVGTAFRCVAECEREVR